MSQLIGKKGNNLNPGYVFAPYIMATHIMATPIVNPKIDKIKKILEKIEDLNLTSS